MNRTCGHEDPKYKVMQEGNKLFEKIDVLVCKNCIEVKPFNDSRLQRELISK